MFDLYETNFGIFNHLDKRATTRRPIASVAMHPSEDFTDESRLRACLRDFIRLQVGKHMNMSFTEFVELPSDIVYLVLEECKSVQSKENAIATEVEAKLKGVGQ